MRRAVLVVGLVAGMAAAASPSTGGSAKTDWVLVKVTVGPEGATNVSIRESLQGNRDPHVRSVLGSGFGTSNRGGVVFVDAGPGGPARISTSSGLGSLDVSETLPTDATRTGISSASGFSGSFAPGEILAVLVFQTGVDWTSVDVQSVTADTGSVTWQVISGSGSTALHQADPNAGGTALAVGSTAAGSSVLHQNTATGIAGGIDWSTCVQCEGSWSGPGGSTGEWTAGGMPGTTKRAQGRIGFAGPAGSWQWTWSGTSTTVGGCPSWYAGGAVLAAWAPIGDEYPLFRSGSGSASSISGCAIG